MPHVRFILVGGFLGAGKTTTIARLARAYVEQGHRVEWHCRKWVRAHLSR